MTTTANELAATLVEGAGVRTAVIVTHRKSPRKSSIGIKSTMRDLRTLRGSRTTALTILTAAPFGTMNR